MEEDRVAGVDEEHDSHEHRGPDAEEACRKEPGNDRPCVQQRHDRLGKRAAGELKQTADEERRARRPAEHVAEVDRMTLEELDVAAEVRREITPSRERHRQSLEPPDHEGDQENHGNAAATIRQQHRSVDERRLFPAEPPGLLACHANVG